MWAVRWEHDARQHFRRIDQRTQRRIVDALDRFVPEGYGDIKRLVAQDAEYRLRIGNWRVLFDLELNDRTLIVVDVLPRGSAYD